MKISKRIQSALRGEAGFSLVELMVALMILTVGMLGLAGVTAYTIQKVSVAELDTERGAALQTVVEQLRAMPLERVANGADTVGIFEVSWSVVDNGDYRTVEIVTVGPGMEQGAGEGGMPKISSAVADTFSYIFTGS
jgi:type IV pilus assembly protein PilV